MIDEPTLKEINLHKFLSKNVIKTLDTTKKMCIDVGLAGDAAHSALWLGTDSSRCSLGIEPLQYHWDCLSGVYDKECDLATSGNYKEWDPMSETIPPERLPAIRLNNNAVMYKNKKICNIEKRFFDIRCAIDNIEDIRVSDFYRLINSGASSLLEPIAAADAPQRKVKEIEKIKCLSLEKILDYVDWEKIEAIEHLKVDCEGKDLDVIKSIGHYINKVVFLTHEASPQHAAGQGIWHNQNTIRELIEHMIGVGFYPVGDTGGDFIWVNKRYIHEALAQYYTCEVIWPFPGEIPHPPPYFRYVPVLTEGKWKFVCLVLNSPVVSFEPGAIDVPTETSPRWPPIQLPPPRTIWPGWAIVGSSGYGANRN